MQKGGLPLNPTKPKLSTPAALLLGGVIGVLLMIFLPNPLDKSVGNTRQNFQTGAEQQAFGAALSIQLAERADAEGRDGLSALFYAIAQAESNQSAVLLDGLPQTEKTSELLEQNLERKQNSAEKVFPGYLEIAEQEGDAASIQILHRVAAAEASHATLMQEALEQFERNLPSSYYLCPECGVIYRDNPPETCDCCQTGAERFVRFE